MSYKRPSKKQIKASLDYLRALAEKDFKPKDYEYIQTGDLTDKLTQNELSWVVVIYLEKFKLFSLD